MAYMRTHMERAWLLALAAKSNCFISSASAFAGFFCLAALLLIIINLIHWAHPGGPAWGKLHRRRPLKPIPGPSGLPFIGSMRLMSGLAHHKISAMAAACNATRLMAFSLGDTRVIVSCNPKVAKEILNSPAFADRPIKESAYRLMFDRAIGFAPYGVYWRTLRKIAATHLFSPRQIKASEPQRVCIADGMVDSMLSLGGADGQNAVAVRDILKRASLTSMMSSVFGQKNGVDDEDELSKLVDQGYALLGVFNWSDHLPWLAEFDLQRVGFRCSRLVPKVNRFVGAIINQRRSCTSHGDAGAFVDLLLNLEVPDKLSDSDMIAVLWEMIFRGTDTVAVLVEWILARLVLHPEVQSRVQRELDSVVAGGDGDGDLRESHVAELVYLTAVVKEVLRLHPPGPLLSWARLAVNDTTVDGYEVPKGTTAMVNMWAITRDPHVWDDPLTFRPDRFLDMDGDFSVYGSDLRLAPFGSGRRTCPGKTLGMSTVTLWVAKLVQRLEFVTEEDGKAPDLSEVLNLSCQMAQPLRVRVRVRPRIIIS